MNYPSPCIGCEKSSKCSHGCDKWKMRFYTIWKQVNTYSSRQYKKVKRKTNKFCYEHPDVARRYLQNGPCKGCEYEKLCDVPCSAYWHWWDARMASLKERYGTK